MLQRYSKKFRIKFGMAEIQSINAIPAISVSLHLSRRVQEKFSATMPEYLIVKSPRTC